MKKDAYNCHKAKLSVITVCLNSERTISKAIQSVISQKNDDIEYIIVDGGSTDHTLSIIKEYGDKIDTVLSEKDNGIYDAMNKGIRIADGDYIGFINSDDWYECNALNRVISKVETQKVDIIYGKMNMQNGGKACGVFKGKGFTNDIWHTMPFGHPASFVKKEIYNRIGLFDTKYKIAADYQWLLRAYVAGATAYGIDDIISNFSQNGISSTNQIEATLEAWVASRELFLDNQERVHGIKIDMIDRIFRENLQYIAAADLLEYYWDSATEYFNKQILKNEQTIVWGAGKWGQRIAEVLEHNGLMLKCFVDNCTGMIGKEKCGVHIECPDEISGFNGAIIIAVRGHENEISMQAREDYHFKGRILFLKCIVEDLFDIHRRVAKNKYGTISFNKGYPEIV